MADIATIRNNKPQDIRIGEYRLKEFIPPDKGYLTQCRNNPIDANPKSHLSKGILRKNLSRRSTIFSNLLEMNSIKRIVLKV